VAGSSQCAGKPLGIQQAHGPVGGGLMGWCPSWPWWQPTGRLVDRSLVVLRGGGLAGWQPSGPAGCCSPPVLSVYHDVEMPSTGQGYRVPKLQFSLVLYLSQVCLQHLSKCLIPRAHTVCVCVPVAIFLEVLNGTLKVIKLLSI
jgi:hypothetical protein